MSVKRLLQKAAQTTALAVSALHHTGCGGSEPLTDDQLRASSIRAGRKAIEDEFKKPQPVVTLEEYFEARKNVVLVKATSRDIDVREQSGLTLLDRSKYHKLDEAFRHFEEKYGFPKADVFLASVSGLAEKDMVISDSYQFSAVLTIEAPDQNGKYKQPVTFSIGKETLKNVENGSIQTDVLLAILAHEYTHILTHMDFDKEKVLDISSTERYVEAAKYAARGERTGDLGACLLGKDGAAKMINMLRVVEKELQDWNEKNPTRRRMSSLVVFKPIQGAKLMVDVHEPKSSRIENLIANRDKIAAACR